MLDSTKKSGWCVKSRRIKIVVYDINYTILKGFWCFTNNPLYTRKGKSFKVTVKANYMYSLIAI